MKVQELAKISSMITEAISLYNADKTGMIGTAIYFTIIIHTNAIACNSPKPILLKFQTLP